VADPRWDDKQIGSMLGELVQRFRQRDLNAALRDALLFRRQGGSTPPQQLGTYLPRPFNKSEMVLRTMSGKLIDRAEHLVGVLTTNRPIIQVNTILNLGQKKPTQQAERHTGDFERCLNGIYFALAKDEQEQVAWSQVVHGVGWIGLWEREAGLGLPDRRFFALGELTEEELEAKRNAGEITPIPLPMPDGEAEGYAESGDLWKRRREEVAKNKAEAGVALFEMPVFRADQVYYEQESSGAYSLVVMLEQMPRAAWLKGGYMADALDLDEGLSRNAAGEITAGLPQGTSETERLAAQSETWYLARVWSRDEVYYYVSSNQTWLGGRCVWYSTHDYGEVPVTPAPAFHSHSRLPESEFPALLDGAFAMIPGFNQSLTLLSNVAAYNAAPRYAVEMPAATATGQMGGGGWMPDPQNPSQPLIITGDQPMVGLDPSVMAVIAGGGKIVPLRIENVDVLINTLEFYAKELEDVMPSRVSTGQDGNDGPAWGARLLSSNSNIKVKPAVDGHASALLQTMKRAARIMRQRGTDVFVLTAPGASGAERGQRAIVHVPNEAIHENLSVEQDHNTAEERLALIEVGSARLQRGEIDLRQFYGEYAGELDVDEAILRYYLKQVTDHVVGGLPAPPGSLIAMVVEASRGRMWEVFMEEFPNAAREVSRSIAAGTAPVGPTGGQLAPNAPPAGGGSAAPGVGVVQPGVGMPPTQAPPPGLAPTPAMLPAGAM